jgi:hypothetical protein
MIDWSKPRACIWSGVGTPTDTPGCRTGYDTAAKRCTRPRVPSDLGCRSMLTFQKRRTFQNSYGTATIDVVYDDGRDDLLHIIRDVTTPDGKVYDNVNLVVRAKDIPDDVVDEAIGMRVNDVVAQKK